MHAHDIPPRSIRRLGGFIDAERIVATERALDDLSFRLTGRRLITVTGNDRRKGGVYEILRSVLPYFAGTGIDVVWLNLDTDPDVRPALEFFHVLAHGVAAGPDWRREISAYTPSVMTFAEHGADAISAHLRPGDVVFAHDTQTALSAGVLAARGWPVLWHSHIGSAQRGEITDAYWSVFAPPLADVRSCVFYVADYIPPHLRNRAALSLPGIDPSATKNTVVDALTARQHLQHDRDVHRVISSLSGDFDTVTEESIVAAQVSRWDPLKDMSGVAAAFGVVAMHDARFHGVLAGTAAQSTNEQRQLADCLQVVEALPNHIRNRLHVWTVSDSGSQAHDTAIQLLQSAADIAVQKSVQEGFGLTVTEAMLKAKPVIASRVGGIPTQITQDDNGLLLDDPADTSACANALLRLCENPEHRAQLGTRARRDALDRFGVDQQVLRLANLLTEVAG